MGRLLGLVKQRGLVPDRKEADWTHPSRSDGSIGCEKDWWVGGPHRSRGRAEQSGGEWGLRLKEPRWRRVGGVTAAAWEGVADGRCHRHQVGGNDLGGQSLTLVVLTQGELDLWHKQVEENIRLIIHFADETLNTFTRNEKIRDKSQLSCSYNTHYLSVCSVFAPFCGVVHTRREP